MALSMRLLHERAAYLPEDDMQLWTSGIFRTIVESVIEAREGETLRSEFLEKFAKEYEDVRFHMFAQIAYVSRKPPC